MVAGPGEPRQEEGGTALEPGPLLTALDATGEAIDARARVIAWALGEVGEQDPRKYFGMCAPQYLADGRDHSRDTSWCGIFVLSALRAAGVVGPDWTWATGLGFVNREDPAGKRWMPCTALPQAPGDVVVFGAPTWHHAIVHSWGNGRVYTVDGNTLPAPREGVATRSRPLAAYGYYSLARLLGEAP